MKLNEMLQERAQVYEQLKALQDKYNDKPMEGAEKDTYGKLETKFDELTASIEAQKKQLERERQMGEQNQAPKGNTDGMKLFARALGGNAAEMSAYKASFTLGDDSQAGYLTAPEQFVEELIKGLDNASVVRSISRIIGPIDKAKSLGYPYRATAATKMTFVAENAESPEETTAAYGRREFKPNRGSKTIKISKSLIMESDMAVPTLREEMMFAMNEGLEDAYMLGDGSSKPLGIFVASASGINTDRDVSTDNTATAVTFDGLSNAKFSLKQQYRRGASWIMHRDLIKNIAKLKDGEGNYIFQPSVALNTPDMLLGAPLHESEYAPNTFTTGKYVAVYGDFNFYWVCDAKQITIQPLVEIYARYNQIGYLFEYFGDGAPVVNEAFARVKLG